MTQAMLNKTCPPSKGSTEPVDAPSVDVEALRGLDAEVASRKEQATARRRKKAAPTVGSYLPPNIRRLAELHPPSAEGFVPRFGNCERHGTYAENALVDGVERWYAAGCPHCRRQERLNALCGAPNLADCTFENYELWSPAMAEAQAEVLAACRAYALRFDEMRAVGRCVLMMGNSGTGKNHLAAAICRTVAGRGVTVLHTSASGVIEMVRATWDDKRRGTQAEVIGGYVAADLLVLDEIGRTAGTPNEQDILFRVIDGRRRENRPVIAIGNLDETGMEAYLGTASFSRLCDKRVVKLRFRWEDYRRRP